MRSAVADTALNDEPPRVRVSSVDFAVCMDKKPPEQYRQATAAPAPIKATIPGIASRMRSVLRLCLQLGGQSGQAAARPGRRPGRARWRRCPALPRVNASL